MDLRVSKWCSLLVLFAAISGGCPAFGQSNPKMGTTTSTSTLKPFSRMRMVVPAPSESKWTSDTELTQTQPVNNEKPVPSTYIDQTTGYKWNETYWAGVEFSGSQKWPKPKEGEDAPQKTFFWDDTYLEFGRSDEVNLDFSVGLPTSDYSRTAGRNYSLAAAPSVVYDGPYFKLKIKSFFIYNNNKWSTVEDKGEEANEAYAIFPQATLTLKITKEINWYTKATVYQGIDTEGNPKENYSITTGPDYRFNPNLKMRLAYSTQDKVFSDTNLFSRDISSMKLSAFVSF